MIASLFAWQDDDGFGETWLDTVEIVNMATGTVESAQLPAAGALGCAAVHDGYFYWAPGRIPSSEGPATSTQALRLSNEVFRTTGESITWILVP